MITSEQFQEAVENNMGYCTTCQEFTREGTEPDAENYDCPQCEKNTVMGAEQALICDVLSFEE
jgi:hypothetical protein